MSGKRVVVVGAGVFGITAACELRRRGHDVLVLDAASGDGPNADSSSVDSSRALRVDYGGDDFHFELACSALAAWRDEWRNYAGESFFREQGFLFASAVPLDAGGFEADSFAMLQARSVATERLTQSGLAKRWPVFASLPWVDGYVSATAGYVDAAAVMAWLQLCARELGVEFLPNRRIVAIESAPLGLRFAGGERIEASRVLIACGAWTRELLPELAPWLRSTAQTVLYLAPDQADRFAELPTWAYDIAGAGWYGFPANAEGLVKVGHHGSGREQPADDRSVDPELEPRIRRFLESAMPELGHAQLVEQRVCFYCDSIDGDFWIDRVPERPGVFVAAGGSGHGFKFAPLLGDMIANAIEGREDSRLARFAWREPCARREAARAGD